MWCVWVYDVNSLVDWLNVKTCDIWEENVTIRKEVKTEHILSIGFRDIIEGVSLQMLGCVRIGSRLSSKLWKLGSFIYISVRTLFAPFELLVKCPIFRGSNLAEVNF